MAVCQACLTVKESKIIKAQVSMSLQYEVSCQTVRATLTCKYVSHCDAQERLIFTAMRDLDLHQGFCALLQQSRINVLKHGTLRKVTRCKCAWYADML